MERWSATRQIGGVFSKVDPFSSFARSLNEETKINQVEDTPWSVEIVDAIWEKKARRKREKFGEAEVTGQASRPCCCCSKRDKTLFPSSSRLTHRLRAETLRKLLNLEP